MCKKSNPLKIYIYCENARAPHTEIRTEMLSQMACIESGNELIVTNTTNIFSINVSNKIGNSSQRRWIIQLCSLWINQNGKRLDTLNTNGSGLLLGLSPDYNSFVRQRNGSVGEVMGYVPEFGFPGCEHVDSNYKYFKASRGGEDLFGIVQVCITRNNRMKPRIYAIKK